MTILPPPYEAMFLTFFFVYVRISAAVYTMPIISNDTVTPPVRAGLAFWITVVLLGPVWGFNEAQLGWSLPIVTRVFNGVLDFGLAVAAEALIGMTLGFIGQMMLQTIALAGEMIGQQSGFSAASVFDPITGQDIFLIAQINILFGTLIFIVIGGIEHAFSALAESFHVVRPGEGFNIFAFGEAGMHTLLFDQGRQQALANLAFKVALQIAAPMMGAMILISLAEGFIARTVPQLNVMAVGFAVRISMSLLILAWMMRPFFVTFREFLFRYMGYAGIFLQHTAAG